MLLSGLIPPPRGGRINRFSLAGWLRPENQGILGVFLVALDNGNSIFRLPLNEEIAVLFEVAAYSIRG